MHGFFQSSMALLVWTIGVGAVAAPHASGDETAEVRGATATYDSPRA